jgi:LDH2 family malate/lactate/ureidoglycolate dehydrogenase
VLNGGAIRVFDRSHKGSNLALMVELLAGPLVGAAVEDKLQVWGRPGEGRSVTAGNRACPSKVVAQQQGGLDLVALLQEKNWGNLVVAISPELLGDPGTIRARVQTVLNRWAPPHPLLADTTFPLPQL